MNATIHAYADLDTGSAEVWDADGRTFYVEGITVDGYDPGEGATLDSPGHDATCEWDAALTVDPDGVPLEAPDQMPADLFDALHAAVVAAVAEDRCPW